MRAPASKKFGSDALSRLAGGKSDTRFSPVPPAPPGGIVAGVAARIVEAVCRADHPVGHRLTEQALADSLAVSRSPVRRALQFLESIGAVESQPNRGFFLAKTSAQLRKMRVPGQGESDEAVYMKVADDRLAGKLPEEIVETELMQRYGMTRLQVQRILNRMGREGMVERKAGRGWAFRPLLQTAEAHGENYRFRMIIEPAGLLEPTFRIDKPAFERARRQQMRMLDGGIDKWSRSELFRVGAELHETIIACSGNQLLIDSLRKANELRRVLEYRANVDRSRFQRQCEEHLMLLDLIESGDRVEAAHAMREHLNTARRLKVGEALPTTPAARKSRRVAAGHR